MKEYLRGEEKPRELTTQIKTNLKDKLVDESKRFFVKDITTLEVPDAFYKTQERLRKIGLTRFEPLVLPQMTLVENDPWWEGKVKPELLFWTHIQKSLIKPESAILQKGVYLIDGRAKPDDLEGQQRYEDDGFMEQILKRLRRKGSIKDNYYYPAGTRFNVSPYEIERVILPELAGAIGKDALGSEGIVMNNPFKIFNVVGNMRHPEWGKTNTAEWFDNRAWGGMSNYGGLGGICFVDSFIRTGGIAFRPLLAFPSKT